MDGNEDQLAFNVLAEQDVTPKTWHESLFQFLMLCAVLTFIAFLIRPGMF